MPLYNKWHDDQRANLSPEKFELIATKVEHTSSSLSVCVVVGRGRRQTFMQWSGFVFQIKYHLNPWRNYNFLERKYCGSFNGTTGLKTAFCTNVFFSGGKNFASGALFSELYSSYPQREYVIHLCKNLDEKLPWINLKCMQDQQSKHREKKTTLKRTIGLGLTVPPIVAAERRRLGDEGPPVAPPAVNQPLDKRISSQYIFLNCEKNTFSTRQCMFRFW